MGSSFYLKVSLLCLQRHWGFRRLDTFTSVPQPPSWALLPEQLALAELSLAPGSFSVFNPGNLLHSLIQISVYTLCKLAQASLLSSVLHCLLVSCVDRLHCHFKLNMSQTGIIKFICSQFFKQIVSSYECTTIHGGINFLAGIFRRRYLSPRPQSASLNTGICMA